MKKILALDVGGTKINYAVVNSEGEIINAVQKKSTPKTKGEIETLFISIIKQYEQSVDAIAIATAGTVNKDNNGVVGSTHNVPEGYNTIKFLTLSQKPVFVENDANAAAWAEYKIGAAKGETNTITITLGTGIGGGFIIDGHLLRGFNGQGGEVGSMKILGRNRKCTCFRKDCFESYASGSGLRFTAIEFAKNNIKFKQSIFKDKSPEKITTYDIISGVENNDEYSIEVFNRWKQDLIIGLINIANIFNPESIVISGGMGKFINTEEIQKEINKEIVVAPVKIKLAKAGNYSGLIGVALLAVEKLNKVR